ncbi:hypothetical protein BJ166DRAFT_527047 [Pestalotiopsis sp. NC0098]|nr:hypothetical protein BJ166DRAFT_527047 [Pestalotiopsis sp. NC0098]
MVLLFESIACVGFFTEFLGVLGRQLCYRTLTTSKDPRILAIWTSSIGIEHGVETHNSARARGGRHHLESKSNGLGL